MDSLNNEESVVHDDYDDEDDDEDDYEYNENDDKDDGNNDYDNGEREVISDRKLMADGMIGESYQTLDPCFKTQNSDDIIINTHLSKTGNKTFNGNTIKNGSNVVVYNGNTDDMACLLSCSSLESKDHEIELQESHESNNINNNNINNNKNSKNELNNLCSTLFSSKSQQQRSLVSQKIIDFNNINKTNNTYHHKNLQPNNSSSTFNNSSYIINNNPRTTDFNNTNIHTLLLNHKPLSPHNLPPNHNPLFPPPLDHTPFLTHPSTEDMLSSACLTDLMGDSVDDASSFFQPNNIYDNHNSNYNDNINSSYVNDDSSHFDDTHICMNNCDKNSFNHSNTKSCVGLSNIAENHSTNISQSRHKQDGANKSRDVASFCFKKNKNNKTKNKSLLCCHSDCHLFSENFNEAFKENVLSFQKGGFFKGFYGNDHYTPWLKKEGIEDTLEKMVACDYEVLKNVREEKCDSDHNDVCLRRPKQSHQSKVQSSELKHTSANSFNHILTYKHKNLIKNQRGRNDIERASKHRSSIYNASYSSSDYECLRTTTQHRGKVKKGNKKLHKSEYEKINKPSHTTSTQLPTHSSKIEKPTSSTSLLERASKIPQTSKTSSAASNPCTPIHQRSKPQLLSLPSSPTNLSHTNHKATQNNPSKSIPPSNISTKTILKLKPPQSHFNKTNYPSTPISSKTTQQILTSISSKTTPQNSQTIIVSKTSQQNTITPHNTTTHNATANSQTTNINTTKPEEIQKDLNGSQDKNNNDNKNSPTASVCIETAVKTTHKQAIQESQKNEKDIKSTGDKKDANKSVSFFGFKVGNSKVKTEEKQNKGLKSKLAEKSFIMKFSPRGNRKDAVK